MNKLTHTHWNMLMAGLVLTACLAVFTLYTQPVFLQALANQVWGCL